MYLAQPSGLRDLSSPTGDRTRAPAVEAWSLNHWTARGSPSSTFFFPQKNDIDFWRSQEQLSFIIFHKIDFLLFLQWYLTSFSTPPVLPLNWNEV